MKVRFEWDLVKAKTNFKKHRVSFDIAIRAFSDPFALVEQDRIEGMEHRWRTLGLVDGYLLLLVAHVVWHDKEGVEVIRIISARRAEPRERKRYEENRLS